MNMNHKREFTTFESLWNDPDLITQEEKDRIDFEVSLIGKLIEARESRGMTQKELAERAGLQQSAIARMESLRSIPQIDTLHKVLRPLGYKLDIVPIEKLSSSSRPPQRLLRRFSVLPYLSSAFL